MWHILVHGGAAPLEETDLAADRLALRAALSVGSETLRAGAHALDVVEATVRSLEDSARFIAGKGACPNELGRWELDACICDGSTRRIGAVACLEGYSHPISVARFIMERTKNVLLTGVGAARFAERHGFEEVTDPHTFFVPSSAKAGSVDDIVHGTVGAVALDQGRRLAAATSTGGAIGKRAGRVGDTPLAGAGTWADPSIAVSCTGQGEFFIRTAAAHSVAARVSLLNETPCESIKHVIAEIHALGGEGGIICLDEIGRGGCAFNSEAMRWGAANANGFLHASIATRSTDVVTEIMKYSDVDSTT